ncbi:MAG: hypothetical protein O2954_17425 [bacterium]|nr:hypothetical protein [bacterium]
MKRVMFQPGKREICRNGLISFIHARRCIYRVLLRKLGIFAVLILASISLSHSQVYAEDESGMVRSAGTEEMGNGFYHHGVATPISNRRGLVSTVDGEGRNVVLVWLFDHRGGYAILMVDAETGKSESFPVPFPPGGDCPYASILSSGNKYYTHFNSYFSEFDPVKRAFTFYEKTAPQMAMSMTEDDDGQIWSATYPNSGLVSFDPETRTFKDYGHLYDQNWRQYPRSVAVDDAGWVYFGVGSTAGQIVAFNPKTKKATPMIAEDEREKGSGHVYRDLNGKVYGRVKRSDGSWIEFYRGNATPIDTLKESRRKPLIAGSQGLYHRTFPDGKRIGSFSLVDRELVVENPEMDETKRLPFDYASEGAHLMGLAVAPDSTICGGTAFPMRFFSYNPRTDMWINRASYGQWNTVARQGDRFFVGGYTGGFLLEWDPANPWVATEKDDPEGNPRFLMEARPDINRPHELLAHPDGKTVVLAGTPGYGYTGGGLVIWDREAGEGTLLKHTDLLPEQSTVSLVVLEDGKLLGGSTTSAGTGGEKKAKEAELYVFNLNTKKIEWHQAVFPGVQGYTDLWIGQSGMVYGFADRGRFFVFDPQKREVVHEENTRERLGATVSNQESRVFVAAPDGAVYLLFRKGIARMNPDTYEIRLLAESPVSIEVGGDILDGRIYFAHGSHVYSYQVPE